MSYLILRVEIEISTHIDTAVSNAMDLARRLDLRVNFDFNGVEYSVFPNDNATEVKDRAERISAALKNL